MATDNKYIKYQNKSVKIVEKPEEGENISVYVRPGDLVDFKIPGIDFEDLEYELVGGDIVVDIPGQGTFTFVSMALMGYNDTPPSFSSNSGKQISLSDVLSEVEEINALPVDSLVSNVDINIPDNTARDNQEGDDTENNQANPQVIIQEVLVEQDESEFVDEPIDTDEFEIPPSDTPEVVEVVFTSNEVESAAKTQVSVTEGATPTLSFDIDVQHIELLETKSDNVITVDGGGGVAYENIYPEANTTADRAGIIKQTDSETIDFSDIDSVDGNSLVINADNSTYFGEDKVGRTILLSPSQPEGFAVETITLSASIPLEGFVSPYGTVSGNSWVVTKDNPATDEIDGFTFDSSGNIQVTFAVARGETVNFELTVKAESIFSLENVSDERKTEVEVPVTTNIEAEMTYGVNIKEVQDINNPEEYMFESYTSETGDVVETGFVLTTNINDNIVYGSESIKNIINGSIANDTITAGTANDTISGNKGDDTIISKLGEDNEIDGNDNFDGGEGNDTIDFSSITNQNGIGVNANLNTGVITGNGTDSITNVENVVGTQSIDIVTGDANVNILQGEAGNDTLSGLAGDDTIEGGLGNDTIEGGLGEDVLKGDDGVDTASYENATSSVTVNLQADSSISNKGSSSGADGIDELWDFENVIGSSYDDTIEGNSGNNSLSGSVGNEIGRASCRERVCMFV